MGGESFGLSASCKGAKQAEECLWVEAKERFCNSAL